MSSSTPLSPRRLFRIVATAEAITWTGLLAGMYLKYGPETTEAGVRVFGMLHGIVFITFVLTTVVAWTDQRWSAGRGLLALAAAIPPLATLPLEWRAARRDWLGETWRLRTEEPATPRERVVAWLVRNPSRGLTFGAAGVGVLTAVALLVGPPTS